VAAAASTGKLSIIIPALNEAGCIQALCTTLQPLRRLGHEVILVDGGSVDDTVKLASPLVDKTIVSGKGRAVQMQTGANAAKGAIFWFLHADSGVPENADLLIREALARKQTDWGRFNISLQDKHPALRCVELAMNLRSSLTGIATGDQGIFVRRSLYEQVGGIPPLPLMEDIAFSRALKKHCRPACIRQPLLTSARRWRQHGIFRTILTMWSLRLAYFIGISPDQLVKHYTVNRT
jgi:rSAM/selenodomain-associated transferase 2